MPRSASARCQTASIYVGGHKINLDRNRAFVRINGARFEVVLDRAGASRSDTVHIKELRSVGFVGECEVTTRDGVTTVFSATLDAKRSQGAAARRVAPDNSIFQGPRAADAEYAVLSARKPTLASLGAAVQSAFEGGRRVNALAQLLAAERKRPGANTGYALHIALLVGVSTGTAEDVLAVRQLASSYPDVLARHPDMRELLDEGSADSEWSSHGKWAAGWLELLDKDLSIGQIIELAEPGISSGEAKEYLQAGARSSVEMCQLHKHGLSGWRAHDLVEVLYRAAPGRPTVTVEELVRLGSVGVTESQAEEYAYSNVKESEAMYRLKVAGINPNDVEDLRWTDRLTSDASVNGSVSIDAFVRAGDEADNLDWYAELCAEEHIAELRSAGVTEPEDRLARQIRDEVDQLRYRGVTAADVLQWRRRGYSDPSDILHFHTHGIGPDEAGLRYPFGVPAPEPEHTSTPASTPTTVAVPWARPRGPRNPVDWRE